MSDIHYHNRQSIYKDWTILVIPNERLARDDQFYSLGMCAFK